MNPQLMSQGEYAAHRGVKKSAVSNWKKQNLLVFAEGAAGKMMIDVARTDAKLNANIDPTRGRPTTAQSAAVSEPDLPLAPAPSSSGGELSNVRTELIRAQTQRIALDNAKRAGELVSLAEFERLATENGRVTRDRMIAVIRTNAERLAAEKDPRLIVALMTDEIDKAMVEISEGLMRGEGGDDDEALDAIDQAEDAITAETDEESVSA